MAHPTATQNFRGFERKLFLDSASRDKGEGNISRNDVNKVIVAF